MTQVVKVGSEIVVNPPSDVTTKSGASIAELPGGRFVVRWGSLDDVDISGFGANNFNSVTSKFQIFNADGTKAGNEVDVQSHSSPNGHVQAPNTSGGSQEHHLITKLDNGNFVVLSDDRDTLHDSIEIFNATGSPVGAPFVDVTSEITPAVAALHNGNFVVVYQQDVASPPAGTDAHPVEVRLFDPNGNPLGAAFKANTSEAASSSAGGINNAQPTVTALAGGKFVVTYLDSFRTTGFDNEMRGQVFNADGTRSGNEFVVASFAIQPADVAALPNGDFVVVWNNSSSLADISGEIFNPDGTVHSGPFTINTVTPGFQTTPQVAALSSGQFVVTWADHAANDGTLAAKVLNPDGTAASAEFLVATGGGDPAVSGLADGSFVITWDVATASQILGTLHAQIFNFSTDNDDTGGAIPPTRVIPPVVPPPTFPPDGPDGPTGGGWGDVHLYTYDGTAYNFQAAGEFELVKSTSDAFEVQIRLQPWLNNPVVTVVTAVGIEFGTHHVTFDIHRPDALLVDGHTATFDVHTRTDDLGDGYSIVQSQQNYWTLHFATGEIVTVAQGGSNFDVRTTLGFNHPLGSVEGLLGNFDRDFHNDLQLADGTVETQPIDNATLYGAFADSWRVTQANSLLDYNQGQTTDTFTDKSFPADAVTLADLPADVLARATAAVDAAGITDPFLRSAAILDYALTNDPGFFASASTAALQGVTGGHELDVTNTTPAAATVGLSALQATQVQAASGTTNVTFEAFRTGDTGAAVTLHYDVAEVSAGFLGAADFGGTAPSGTVTIAAGQASATFNVAVPAGALGTNAFENLRVEITDPAGLLITAATAQTEIFNRTAEPGVHAIPVFVTASQNGTLTQNGDAWTLDLGTVVQGTPVTLTGFLANDAGSQANTLTPFLSASGDAAFSNLFLSTGFSLTLTPDGLGTVTDVIYGDSSESNPTGFSADLPEQTLTITANVVAPAGVSTFAGARVEYDVRTELGNDNVLHTVVTDEGAAGDGTQTLTAPSGIEFSDHHIFAVHGAQQNHAANFDGGRFDDVLFQHAGDGQLVYARMIDGAFQNFAVASTSIGSDWHVLATGDVNPSAESGAELFAQQASSGILAYSSNDSGQIVWHVVSATLTPDDRLVAAADVNGDGSVDAVIQNDTSGTVQYFDLKGGAVGNLLPAVQNINADWHVAGAGDLNGDGFADIVLQQASTGVTIYADVARGSFANFAAVSTPGTDWQVKAVADINGDGFADVVFQSAATNSVIYADMNGGAFHGFVAVTNGLPATWQVKGAADIDNDGYADVIVQDSQSGQTVYANMHGGQFTTWGGVTNGIDSTWHAV